MKIAYATKAERSRADELARQDLSKIGALPAKLGHGDDIPQRTARWRADCENRTRAATIRFDEGATRGDGKTEAKRIGSRPAVGKEMRDQLLP